MGTVKVDAYKCERCGHVWIGRKKEKRPIACSKCKSAYWDTPRKK